MIQNAIKQLWAAKTRGDATLALDEIENQLDGDCEALSDAEFYSLMKLIRVKNKKLPGRQWMGR
jgi:hypothetical protein